MYSAENIEQAIDEAYSAGFNHGQRATFELLERLGAINKELSNYILAGINNGLDDNYDNEEAATDKQIVFQGILKKDEEEDHE